MYFRPLKPEIHVNKGTDVPVHATKAYGAEGIAPPIVNLGIRWSWAASFKSWLLYLSRKLPGAHWSETWVGSRAGLHIVVQETSLALDWSEVQLPGQNWSPVTMPTKLSRLPNNNLLLIEISTKYATYKMVHLPIKKMPTDSSPTGEYSFNFNNFRIRRTQNALM